MKIPCALVLLAAVAAAQESPEGEWERPWAGTLPDAEQRFGDDEHPGSERLATRILDAATGRPIPGARLVRTPEWIAGACLHHDAVMSMGTADADGVASVPALGHLHREDSHWLAMAPGYAPMEDYGAIPEPEMHMKRGIPMSLRVLDPLGRPVEGAVVEFLGGCSHGTAGARAVAGADGVASFPNLEAGSGQFWVYGPGIASDLLAVPGDFSLGTRPDETVMSFGRRFEGTVVDLLGEPLPACVVRVHNEQRGPTAMTGADGRFVLEGAEDGMLYFYPAIDLTSDGQESWLEDVHPGVPFTVIVSSAGIVRPAESARVVVHARDAEGKSVGDVAYSLVHRDTGRGPSGTTDEESEEGDEVEGKEVAPGVYRVLPADSLAEYTFDPVEVRAVAGKRVEVAVVVRAQPHLRILGDFPKDADLVLAVEGETDSGNADDESWIPALPATGAAVLRVEIDDRPPFFFPVGPLKDGLREVTVALPAPRRVPLPPGAKDARLFSGPRQVLGFEEEGALCTDATGPLVLRWRGEDGATREVSADRPGAAPRTVVRKVTIRALGPGEDGKEETFHDGESEPGDTVVVEREGWRTLRVIAPSQDLDLRWGTTTLHLTLLMPSKEPADALVLVDGEVYAAPEGVLELRGLEAGPHRVVAAIRDASREEREGGRELRLVLKDGETRERTVTLGGE